MFSWATNFAFQGLVKSTVRKICHDYHMPETFALPFALMLAHAAYPTGRWGTSDIDAILTALPNPVMDWDSAGKVAHRYVHFNEGTVEMCIHRMYGRPASELLERCAEKVG
jgi:hypothetical protein